MQANQKKKTNKKKSKIQKELSTILSILKPVYVISINLSYLRLLFFICFR